MAQRVKVTGRDIEFLDDSGRVRAKMGLDANDQIEVTTFATTGDVNIKRILADPDAAVLEAADVVIGAQWGVGATFAITTGSTSMFGSIQVTAAGSPSANGTIVITYPEGAHARSPRFLVARSGGSHTATNTGVQWSAASTALTITFLHALTAAQTVVISWAGQQR